MAAPTRPNIVFFLTDDETVEMVSHNPAAMPYLQSRLANPADHWITFDHAYYNTPICCPTRTSLFTGLYSHHTGVETNGQGVALRNFEGSTIATWLHGAGYYTGLIGKYINTYPFGGPYYIPPGWDRWAANFGDYYNYTNDEDGTLVHYGSAPADYSTDVIARKSVDFINTAPTGRPFFLYVAPKSGHDPWTPAPRDIGALNGMAPTRWPDFNEADVSDKPAFIRKMPLMNAAAIKEQDRRRQVAMETILSADDAIRDIFTALTAKGQLENTIFIFTSDNGFSFGEHRWKTKKCEYEECARMPLLIRYPGAVSRTEHRLVSSVDIAPTLAALAGTAPASAVDGVSIVPLLNSKVTSWRTALLMHAIDDGYAMPGYWAVHTEDYQYVELDTGEKELYDLTGANGPPDPYELDNRAGQPAYAAVQASLAAQLAVLKAASPTPPSPTPTPPPPPDTSPPTLTITSPRSNQVFVAGAIHITGTAVDATGVASVNVAIQDLLTKKWLHSNGTWGGYFQFPTTLTSAGATSTPFGLTSFPLAPGSYGTQFRAIDTLGHAIASNYPWRAFTVS
ncbi:MAG: sulfatase-like hydrolase/transferase [Actinomycetota bacterium]